MTAFGAAAVLLTILAIGLACSPLTPSRLFLIVSLLIYHIGASVAYYLYSLTHLADSSDYYYDYMHTATYSFALGSMGLKNFVQIMRDAGATYFDCFMIFQLFGFAGLMILARTLQEIEGYMMVPEHRGYLILLFLPTMNFWTAAIGKDAPLFLAISLCVWSMLNLRKRVAFFCIALGIMLAFRAHIALMAASALAAATLFDRSVSSGRKLGLLTFALLGMWFSMGAVESTLGLDATSVSGISEFVNETNDVNAGVGGTTSMGDASFPLRFASLLFRPFFFDAHGLMGIIPSFENIAVVIAFIYTLAHWRDLAHLARRVMFIRFIVLYALMILLGLALVYYNVGLGIRERIMAAPMVVCLLVALWSMRQRRAPAAGQPVPPNLLAGANGNRAVPEL